MEHSRTDPMHPEGGSEVIERDVMENLVDQLAAIHSARSDSILHL